MVADASRSLCGRIERRRDDRRVAGAAAEMAAEQFADRRFARIGVVAQDR